MRVLLVSLLAALWMASAPAAAQEQEIESHSRNNLLVDLAIDHIDITAGFNGSDIILFGSKSMDGDIAVTVRGPERDMVVRKKDQIAGAWLNRRSVLFEGVPVFYAYALSAPAGDLASKEFLAAHGIGISEAKLKPAENYRSADNLGDFRKALIRNRIAKKLFPAAPEKVIFQGT